MKREDLLAHDDRRRAEVEVPEWNTTITIRQYSLAEIMQDRSTLSPLDSLVESIILAVIDPETGALIFQPDDAPALKEKSSAVLVRINKAIQELNSFDVKALEKNS